MFNNTFKILFAVLFLVLGGVFAANAQIENGTAIRITVPHSFVIRDKTFPAGNYVITPLDQIDGSTHLLKLQGDSGREFAVFDTMEKTLNTPSKHSELVFDQAGGEYILTEIRVEGDDQANQILATRSEKQAIAAAAVN